MLYIFGVIFLLLLVLGVIFYNKYNSINDINDKLDISMKKIKELFDFKNDKVKEILEIINDEKYNYRYEHINEEFTLKENEIFILFWDLKKEFENNKKISKIISEVEKNENDLEGLKDFYNSNINLYNEIYEKIPFNIFFKLLKFKPRNSFESKKIEDYEILKD